MDRTTLALAVAATTGSLILLAGPAGAAQPTPVTITFTGTGTAPLACGSRPDVDSLVVARGQPLVLANLTGAEATIDVGATTPLTVASGDGISVKLRQGVHLLRMVPNCVIVGEVGQTSVEVVAAPPIGPPPGGSVGGPANDEPPVPRDQALSGADASVGPSRGDAPPGAEGQATTSGPTAADSVGAGVDPQAGPVEATSVVIDPTSNEKLARLLAIIAAICVLGVTAGIIRAIVTHRTRVSLRTLSSK
jgi:hypothetical protein